MSDKILQDIVESLTHHQPNLELIVDDSAEEASFYDTAARERADIVIFELMDKEIPRICDELLDRLPDAVLLGFVSKGHRIVKYALYAEEMDTDELINSIMVSKKRFLHASN